MPPGNNQVSIEQVVQSNDRLGETPLWCDRTNTLWWLDVEQPRLQHYDPASDAHVVYPFDCDWLGSLALTTDNSLLVATDLSLQRFDPATGISERLVDVEHNIDNRLNDGRVDHQGRFWVGTMDNGLSEPNGSLYRVDAGRQVTTHLKDIIVSNGIAHAPDGRTLYLTDTRRFVTWSFEVNPQAGTLHNQRLFADYRLTGERPDGATVDVDGCLWQAFFSGGKVVRYTPEGAVDRLIELPVSNPTCICFGGADYRTLYITTARKFLSSGQLASEPLAGSLLAIYGAGQGLAENRFG